MEYTDKEIYGWTLDDGVERHRDSPKSFEIPDVKIRKKLQPGDYAKLIFRITLETADGAEVVERMWVVVRENTPAGYIGILDNTPYSVKKNDQLWLGAKIFFEPRHIINVEYESDESQEADETFFHQLHDERTGYSVIFDDDGKVAYAYLYDAEKRIVSDVWLYNRGANPTTGEWSDRSKLPFQNPAGYVRELIYKPVSHASELSVEWASVAGYPMVANLFIREKFFACLKEGVAPGWSVLAICDGPLAQVLESK